MKRIGIFILVLFTAIATNAQKLSAYKFIVVPAQFKLQREAGQYNLNKLVASTFEKFDFESMIEGDNPPIGFDPCKALKVIANKRGFLKTYISLSLKDCYGKTVHTTIEGYSAKKDFQKSYYEAFRGVFEDPYIQNHTYDGEKIITSQQEESTKSREEIIAEAKRRIKLEEAQELKEAAEELNAKKMDENEMEITNSSANANGSANANTTRDYSFEFLGKQYDFKKSLSGFDIFTDNAKLGVATKLANGQYNIKAGALTGSGTFDAFGNFILRRINPINKQEITDTLARIK